MENADARASNSVSEDQSPGSDKIVQRWTADIGSGDLLPPVANNKGLIVGTGRPDIFAVSLNLETGERQWQAQVDKTTHAPFIAGENHIFVVYNHEIYSLHSGSGEGERSSGVTLPEEAFRFVDLIATQDYVLFVAESGILGAVNRGTNHLAWQYEVDSSNTPVKVAACMETAYLITKEKSKYGCQRSGRIYAVDLSSGSKEWSKSLPSRAREVAITDDAVVVGTVGDIQAFAPSSGTRIWKKDSKTSHPSLAIQANKLVVGGYRQLSTVDLKSGETIWVEPFQSDHISPAISGETIYTVGSGKPGTNWNAQIRNFDIGTGLPKASHNLNENRLYGPVLINNSLYISSDSGNVYAFDGGK